MAYLRRQMSRQAKRIIAVDEWNINWLGEEMRPFNSQHSWNFLQQRFLFPVQYSETLPQARVFFVFRTTATKYR